MRGEGKKKLKRKMKMKTKTKTKTKMKTKTKTSSKSSSYYEDKVCRIYADSIEMNFQIPFMMNPPNRGQGTGFFIDKHGYFLTCAHVVDNATRIYIEIPSHGSKKYEAEVVGICFDLDTALLRVKEKGVKIRSCFRLGDSKRLSQGDHVNVIGFPANFMDGEAQITIENNLKITEGIISGFQYGKIQTDAPINAGNSGGPLVNHRGEVVGINSSKVVDQSIENVGYSVPMHHVKVVLKEMYSREKASQQKKMVEVPSLGGEFCNGSEGYLGDREGVFVSKVYKGGFLEKVGIEAGDVILSLDGKKMDHYGKFLREEYLGSKTDLDYFLNDYAVGEKMRVEYLRDGKMKRVVGKLMPHQLPVRILYHIYEPIEYILCGSMVLMNLALNHVLLMPITGAEYLKVSKRAEEKVVISYIYPNSTINKMDILKTFDVISKIDGVEIKNLEDVKKALVMEGGRRKNRESKFIRFENDEGKVAFFEKEMLKSEVAQFASLMRG